MSHTRLPSVTGDGEDMFCFRSMWLPPAIGRFQIASRLLRSTAHSSSSPVVLAVAVLRKTRLSQMMGVDPL
jgi:hypothetical protein